jgi:polysaccharide export outer membrane protein
MRSFLGFIAVYLLACAVTTAAGQTSQGSTPGVGTDERYRIGFQDQLDVQVFRHPELAQRVNVNSNGTVNLFRLEKPIVAVCKTERELASDIAAAYEKDYLRNPEVNVIAVEQRSRAFAVIGAVEKPGNYFINRRIRLLELLAQAGGPSKDAGTRLIVARTGSTSNCKLDEDKSSSDDVALMDFKISDVMQAKTDLIMRPGDIVSVLDSDIVYIYGNVNKQGQIEIKEPLTLTQALASAQGLKPATDKSKIRILRQKPGSRDRDEFVYDLNEIDKRKIQDPFLEPNDVVAVSEDKTKSILNSIGRSLTGGIPSIFYRIP